MGQIQTFDGVCRDVRFSPFLPFAHQENGFRNPASQRLEPSGLLRSIQLPTLCLDETHYRVERRRLWSGIATYREV